MSERDRRLAATKYKNRKSASEEARESELRALAKKGKLHSGLTPEEFYEEWRKTPKAREHREKYRKGLRSHLKSGGGEEFADRDTGPYLPKPRSFWRRK